MSEKMKKQEVSAEEMSAISGGKGEKQRFMVMKDGESTFGPYDTEEEAKQKAKELGAGRKVVPVWGF